ncbi:hypothetical protein TRIATDRAFT_300417 [Trichoderma atroviride IMI 206040]|uniref:Uncharacterized protein n=1 Tax=Hypocrea atroviridis (strain ATCC 20476 / IMI 206040) TaxID=452589 RepID=G9P048_HYPAI|nr:uncharacterized protein TRIATDRAFT_300417 [Trichoderma atroviride IMI 206040]EHK44094.1 hypothetical protein TRIATDRAFT_300417 [Trichoderma atroviride IMI 206040]
MPAPCSFPCMDRSMSVNAQQAMIASRFSNKCEPMDQKSYSRAGYRALGHAPSCALWSLPRPLSLLSPEKLRLQGGHVAEGRGRAFGNRPIQSPAATSTSQVLQCWPICLKTSLFPIAPSGTARLGSCWIHLAAFWDPF